MKFTLFLETSIEGVFIAKCLELPVAAQGSNKEEALKNVKEAIEGYLEVKASFSPKELGNTEVVVTIITEETIVNALSTVPLTKGDREKIKRSVEEMKEGNYVTLKELCEQGNSV